MTTAPAPDVTPLSIDRQLHFVSTLTGLPCHCVAEDPTCDLTRRKSGAGHKSHERTEAPCSRSAQKVQSRYRGFESRIEARRAVDLTNGTQKLLGEEPVARNVDAVTCPQQHVIDPSIAAIVQGDAQSPTDWYCRND